MNTTLSSISNFIVVILLFLVVSCSPKQENKPDEYNVVWDTQSADSWGSMPIGNGDIGANVWVNPKGELEFYISKTDAWSENGRLLKIGKLKLRFIPNLLTEKDFRQELVLSDGMIKINGKSGNNELSLKFWVDAGNPAIYIDGTSTIPVQVKATYEGWRSVRRELTGAELRSAYGIAKRGMPVFVEPDTILSPENALIWCHHNRRSLWKEILEVQALGELAAEKDDPLMGLTFGALVKGDGFVTKSNRELSSSEAVSDFRITVYSLTEKAKTVDDWSTSINKIAESVEKTAYTDRLTNHVDWWANFWNGSHIYVHSASDSLNAANVSRGYQLQRFINACAGRGNMPIKFNGSIFNVDLQKPIRGINEPYDADFRDWGPCYWWQNTRLPYWSMLHSGDFQLMKPLFKMYMDALPLAKYRTNKYYGHKGAYFPETMYFWGTWNLDNYGDDRSGKPDGLSDNQYIRYEWQGGIELVAMMLDYYEFTSDSIFLKNSLMPFASEIIDFYRSHYQKGADEKIIFDPAQALETYWEGTINPMPELAGLKTIASKFITIDDKHIDKTFKNKCSNLLSELAEIPVGEADGGKVLLPAEQLGSKHNVENPELYAIFPYRLFGVGKPDLEIAARTYEQRIHKDYKGWQQDAIQAALLGNTSDAALMVSDNFSTPHEGSRFPAFWGPNYDWVPDQDHGNVNMRALQNMLIQTDGDDILLFPAWPKTWDVDFKLHAPQNTVVEGEFRNGELLKLTVSPESRRKDIRILSANL